MCSQISTGKENFAGGSAVLPTLREGLEIELFEFKAENAMLNGEYIWQGVELVMGDVPPVLEVRYMCLIMSRRRIQLQGSVSTNLFNPMGHQVNVRKLEAGV